MPKHNNPKPEHLGSGGAKQAGSALKGAKKTRDEKIAAMSAGKSTKKRKFSF